MKFSIRDLMWLTVVVALALGWYLDAARTRMEHDKQLTQALDAQLTAETLQIQAVLEAKGAEAATAKYDEMRGAKANR